MALGLPLPAVGEGFEPADLSAAIGGLYVLEGATLGGRVIARHLRRHLGDALILEGGLLDFHGEGASVAWKRFGSALDALEADGLIGSEPASAAAIQVFDRVYAMLARAETAADLRSQ
jgi:heme oxygenase